MQQKYFAGIYFLDWRFCFLFYPVSFFPFFFNKNDKNLHSAKFVNFDFEFFFLFFICFGLFCLFFKRLIFLQLKRFSA